MGITKNGKVRLGMIAELKPEKVTFYKETHAAVWPAVVEKIKDCNIQNYSIFLHQIAEKFYLFSYMEYTGNNYMEDMKRMANDSTTQLWWKEMKPCLISLSESVVEDDIWKTMEEVFHED